MTNQPSAGPELPPERPGLLEGLRGSAAAGVSLVANRLELLGVELAEERVRILALLAYGAAGFIALGAGTVFLAIFITVLLWDSHRLLVLGIFSVAFIGGGLLAMNIALGYARQKSSLFAASLAELRKDSDALKSGQ